MSAKILYFELTNLSPNNFAESKVANSLYPSDTAS